MNIQKSIWFFDIDDTLIDTAGANTPAAEGINKVFTEKFNQDVGKKVASEFVHIFDLLLAGYRIHDKAQWASSPYKENDFNSLLQKIETLQKEIKGKWGAVKKWSREGLIKIASDTLGLKTTPELIHKAADGYWFTLTEKTTVFSGAISLIDYLNSIKRPVFLITSSDGRLTLQDNGQFTYDPAYSESLKRNRIELLRKRGIQFNSVSIGDPEDKPHDNFFIKGIKKAQESIGEFNLANCIMVGDSYAGDLETPYRKLGFGLIILFEKDRKDTIKIDNRFIKTDNLSAVSSFL